MKPNKVLFVVIITGVCVGLPSILAFVIWSTVTDMLSRENAADATIFASELVVCHVEKHGSWPRQWTDLEQLQMDEPYANSWPFEMDYLKEVVYIDFTIQMNDLLQKPPAEISAIRPAVPAYDFYQRYTGPRLLEAVRRHVSEEAGESQVGTGAEYEIVDEE